MTTTSRRVGIVAAWSAAAVLGVGAAAGAATVAFADPTPTPPAGQGEKARPDSERARAEGARPGRHALRHGLRGHGLHGEFVVKKADGTFATLLSQRGEVTAVDGDSVTLKSEDGFTEEYTVNADTRIRRDRAQSKIGDVKVGDTARVVADKSGDGGTARMVIVRTK